MKLISFRLGHEGFAIDANAGLKVVRRMDITPVAAAPAYVAGITSINGQVATILLLEDILQIPAGTPMADRRCIVLKPDAGEAHLAGFMVDVPVDIVQCDAEAVQAPLQVKDNAVTPYIKGLLTYQGEVLRLLDIEGILTMKRGDIA